MKNARVPTTGHASGIQSPFASLEISGAPEAPTSSQDAQRESPKKNQRIALRREKAHRGGKIVIIAYDFPTDMPLSKIEELARRARQHCGCGGTVRHREIELQGDQALRVREFFTKEGFRVVGI